MFPRTRTIHVVVKTKGIDFAHRPCIRTVGHLPEFPDKREVGELRREVYEICLQDQEGEWSSIDAIDIYWAGQKLISGKLKDYNMPSRIDVFVFRRHCVGKKEAKVKTSIYRAPSEKKSWWDGLDWTKKKRLQTTLKMLKLSVNPQQCRLHVASICAESAAIVFSKRGFHSNRLGEKLIKLTNASRRAIQKESNVDTSTVDSMSDVFDEQNLSIAERFRGTVSALQHSTHHPEDISNLAPAFARMREDILGEERDFDRGFKTKVLRQLDRKVDVGTLAFMNQTSEPAAVTPKAAESTTASKPPVPALSLKEESLQGRTSAVDTTDDLLMSQISSELFDHLRTSKSKHASKVAKDVDAEKYRTMLEEFQSAMEEVDNSIRMHGTDKSRRTRASIGRGDQILGLMSKVRPHFDRSALESAFDAADLDGSGTLDVREVANAVVSLFGSPSSSRKGIRAALAHAKKAIEDFDVNGDGFLDPEEFVAFVRQFEKEGS